MDLKNEANQDGSNMKMTRTLPPLKVDHTYYWAVNPRARMTRRECLSPAIGQRRPVANLRDLHAADGVGIA